MGYYQTAQICENGHIITVNHASGSGENFCRLCGSKTIIACPTCNANIRGKYHMDGVLNVSTAKNFPVPSFCYSCGAPYPWTKSALDAAQELLELESELSPEELSYLNENMTQKL